MTITQFAYKERPLLRACICMRFHVHVDLAAARLGCAPKDYFVAFPHMRLAIARKAVADVLGDRCPASGLTDQEALKINRLYAEAWAQPITFEGNQKSGRILYQITRLAEAAHVRRCEDRARAFDPIDRLLTDPNIHPAFKRGLI